MENVRIYPLLNIAMVAGIGVTLGARTAERPMPIERQGEVTGNAVALSIERSRGASDIVLLVDEDEPAQSMDGRVDRGFLLQGGLEPEGGLALDLRGSRIVWDQRSVAVWRGEMRLLELRVMEAPVEDETQIAGFGLSHSIAWDANIPIEGELTPELLAGLRTDIAAVLDVCANFDCRAGDENAIQCTYGCGGEACDIVCMFGSRPCCGCSPIDKLPCCRCLRD